MLVLYKVNKNFNFFQIISLVRESFVLGTNFEVYIFLGNSCFKSVIFHKVEQIVLLILFWCHKHGVFHHLTFQICGEHYAFALFPL